MNAQELVDQLTSLAKSHNIELKDLEVFYRENFDSDHQSINWIFEDSYDEKTNNTLQSVVLVDDGDEQIYDEDED